jgi:hypothetical protein
VKRNGMQIGGEGIENLLSTTFFEIKIPLKRHASKMRSCHSDFLGNWLLKF